MQIYKNYIAGRWVLSAAGETFPSLNPATEQSIGRFQKSNAKDISAAVDAAGDAFEAWSSSPAPKRGEIVLGIAQLLKENKERLARLETVEMGKVLTEARGDVQEAIDIFEYMAGEGRRLFGATTPSELRNKFCMTVRRPVGVVGLITPWNFPIAIPAWKLAPALVCGNSVVWKPSSDTPLCAVELVRILEKAGVPKGVVNLVTGPGDPAGTALVRHKKVLGISFTGNRDTGLWITQHAGIKRVGLELGGKNGIIVMPDADIGLAVDGVVWGAFGTTGQRCTAASRVIVHEKVRKKLEQHLVKRAGKLRLGSGMNPATDVGPLVNRAALEKSERYTSIGMEEGAKILCGGERYGKKGFFFRPTIFTDVAIDMRIAREEIFGPVLSLISVRSLDEAIDAMNAVEYGLSSSIYTNDIGVAFKAIEKIDAGITYVNASTIGAETHLPFGGIKQTGNGTREAGIMGIDEFSEVKTVYIDYSGKLQRAQIDIE
ncbi:MAG: aldehyde dehydrogenase family protein [Candidatus Aenigmarchaeota archaeon]|nr:aldehyde dehydrogenase family protein [Candidatus Aenigmarchaeota archaeon]